MTTQNAVESVRFQRVVVLISGRGSNLVALHAAMHRPDTGGGEGGAGADSAAGGETACDLGAETFVAQVAARIAGVVADRECAGLAWARERSLPAYLVDRAKHADRAAFEMRLGAVVSACKPDLVVMAGFLRIVSASFLHAFAGRVINVHPSLLPAFPGLHTHRRALEAGVLLHGATVHWVTADLDAGPIIGQAVVAVEAGDDEHRLAARVLRMEHRLLPLAVSAALRRGAPPASLRGGEGTTRKVAAPDRDGKPPLLLFDPTLVERWIARA